MTRLSKKDRTIVIRPATAERLAAMAEREDKLRNDVKESVDELGIEYIHIGGKLVRAIVPVKIYMINHLFELFQILSYRDGMDNLDRLDKSQIESFVTKAVKEKVDRCLQDYLSWARSQVAGCRESTTIL